LALANRFGENNMGQKLGGIGLTAFLAVAALAIPTQARADDDGTYKSPLVGSTPNQPIAGVPSGGALWVVRRGEATIQDGGRLKVEVEGLLLGSGASIGTTAGIPSLAASVACGGVVAPGSTTDPAPFSAAGDFEVRQTLTLPQPCRGLVVLVGRPGAAPGASIATYFAASGLPD
jgi:hypothetical protein